MQAAHYDVGMGGCEHCKDTDMTVVSRCASCRRNVNCFGCTAICMAVGRGSVQGGDKIHQLVNSSVESAMRQELAPEVFERFWNIV